jgi:rhodanese-related sulfurtransferase
VKVLWVAEFSSRNTYGADCQVEDTQRHVLEKACVTMLASAKNVRVTYRPYWEQMPWDGTTRWLERAKLRSVRIDPVQAMDVLIRRADVVITDTSSGTVWNEVLALGKPLILYCEKGGRARLAHGLLSQQGVCGIHNLGGIGRWQS